MSYKKIILLRKIEDISFYSPTRKDVIINYLDIYENLSKRDYLNNPPHDILINYEIQLKLIEFQDSKSDRCFLLIKNNKENVKKNILTLLKNKITIL